MKRKYAVQKNKLYKNPYVLQQKRNTRKRDLYNYVKVIQQILLHQIINSTQCTIDDLIHAQ